MKTQDLLKHDPFQTLYTCQKPGMDRNYCLLVFIVYVIQWYIESCKMLFTWKKNRCSRKRGEGPVNKYLWFVIVLISIFLFIKATNSFTFATMAWLTVTEYQMLQMTTDIGSFPHSWLINGFVTRVTRRVSFVEQELLIPVQSTWIRPPVFSSLIFNFPFSVL